MNHEPPTDLSNAESQTQPTKDDSFRTWLVVLQAVNWDPQTRTLKCIIQARPQTRYMSSDSILITKQDMQDTITLDEVCINTRSLSWYPSDTRLVSSTIHLPDDNQKKMLLAALAVIDRMFSRPRQEVRDIITELRSKNKLHATELYEVADAFLPHMTEIEITPNN